MKTLISFCMLLMIIIMMMPKHSQILWMGHLQAMFICVMGSEDMQEQQVQLKWLAKGPAGMQKVQ
ncbi:MAG: hypothetical protein Q8N05_12285 [Bacteroidota bacterium]|nr:hypothetical protein [Bacteroidota bacterium]